MQPDIYVANALYRTAVEHLAVLAGDPDNVTSITVILATNLGLPQERAETLADHLAHLEPCPFAGEITDNEVKVCLGEHGSVWPNSIRGDVLLSTYEEMARH